MKVIMLTGPSSSGKTTVINEVYKIITGGYYKNSRHTDFECEIQHLGKNIAFQSAGDYSYNPINAMRKYVALNFDILVCAHNTNKVNPLKEILKYDHVIITKSEPYKDNASCVIDANQIFNQI